MGVEEGAKIGFAVVGGSRVGRGGCKGIGGMGSRWFTIVGLDRSSVGHVDAVFNQRGRCVEQGQRREHLGGPNFGHESAQLSARHTYIEQRNAT